jgi:hypothetical protein
VRVSVKMRRVAVTCAAWSVSLAACASHELVRADDMSAAQHRVEAQRESEAAALAARRDDPSREAPPPPSDPAVYDPKQDHQGEVMSRREHARQHTAAAQLLERFEDRECRDVPAASRAACPLLGPITRLEDVPGGVRAWFANAKRVPAALAEMRCHYAYARARHFDEAIGCPLYVRAIEIRQALDPSAIEIVSRDQKIARRIRETARQQALFVRQPTP